MTFTRRKICSNTIDRNFLLKLVYHQVLLLEEMKDKNNITFQNDNPLPSGGIRYYVIILILLC